MKQEQTGHNQSNKDSFFQIDLQKPHNEESQIHFQDACCVSGNQCYSLCCSKQCAHAAVVCRDYSCECYQSHFSKQLCSFVPSQKLLSEITNKKRDAQMSAQFGIIEQLQNLIDWISSQIQKIKASIQGVGLSRKEKLLMDLVRDKQFQKLTGTVVSEALDELKFTKSSHLQEFKEYLQSMTQNNLKGIKESINEIHQSLQRYSNSRQSMSIFRLQSLIISTQYEFKTLRDFLPNNKKIQSFEMKYRASENDFSVVKFHQKCDGVSNTVTLIKTEYDKVIGGFTAIPWSSSGNTVNDPTNQTFVFSLTNKDKLNLKPSKQAVAHKADKGPVFGDGSGLWVYDKANTVLASNCDMGESFSNEKYKAKTKECWTLFQGGPGKSREFKIKQWEIFEVHYCKN